MSGLDLVIRGGMVIDGTGADGSIADVGIVGGKVAEIGRIAANGAQEIDADGLAVTPGFIDGHTHMDAQVNWDPLGTNSCWHGVTTVVMGNCGFSVAPVRKGQQALVARNLERAEDISGAAMDAGIDWKWETFEQYLDTVDALPKGINYSAYIGHSALRTWAMGERGFEEEASEDDMALMKQELCRALDAGAMGLSTSRSFAHETSDDRPVASRLASRGEVSELVGTMTGRKNAVFEIAHEVLFPDDPEAAVYWDWLKDLTVGTGVAASFGVLGHFASAMIEYIDKVSAAGGRMFGQTHARGVSTLSSFRTTFVFDSQPVWSDFRKLPLDAQLAGLRDPETRQALADAVKNASYGRRIGAEAPPPKWEEYYYFDKSMPPWRSLAEIAAERGVHPVEALIDLGAATNLDALFLQFLTRAPDEETAAVMRHPSSIMTFSDSGAHVGQIADSSIQSYLIAHFCRETGLLSLPEAINMITGRAANAWGFEGRGVIRQGSIADINIFDPETFAPLMPEVVHDLPGGARRLVQRATGMKATLVAGEVVIENGQHTGALPGRLIRRTEH